MGIKHLPLPPRDEPTDKLVTCGRSDPSLTLLGSISKD